MAASRVASIANTGDGLTVTVTLDVPPAGPVTANASRLPENPASPAAAVQATADPNVFLITARATAIHTRLPYYFQVFDGGTKLLSYQIDTDGQPGAETCEWVCTGTSRDYIDQTEQALLDILIDNMSAIHRGMEIYLGAAAYPGDGSPVIVQKIHAGLPAYEETEKYPQVAIRTTSVEDDPYWANPRSDYNPIRTSIIAYVCHNSIVNWEPLCRALGMAIFETINQAQYLEVPLDCGLYLNECYAMSGTSDAYRDETAGCFVESFTIEWQAKIFLGRELA